MKNIWSTYVDQSSPIGRHVQKQGVWKGYGECKWYCVAMKDVWQFINITRFEGPNPYVSIVKQLVGQQMLGDKKLAKKFTDLSRTYSLKNGKYLKKYILCF